MVLLYKFKILRYILTITRLIYFVFFKKKLIEIKESKNAIALTSSRNKKSMLSLRDCYSGQRSEFFLNKIKKLNKSYNIPEMNVLIVGPRNEGELFNFYSKNFKPNKVDAIDLFTYSPKIKLLDVVNLKKNKKKYDLIYLGFMIAYQKNPKNLINDLSKYLNSNGLIAVTGELVNKTQMVKPTFTQFRHLNDVTKLFDIKYKKVLIDQYEEKLFYFRQNARCYCGIFKKN